MWTGPPSAQCEPQAWVDCFTISLHSTDGRQFCLPSGLCKGLWALVKCTSLHYGLQRMHWTYRYPLSIFRQANHTRDDTTSQLYCRPCPIQSHSHQTETVKQSTAPWTPQTWCSCMTRWTTGPWTPGVPFNKKTVFPGISISLINKVRWLWDLFIIAMGIPILLRHHYTDTASRALGPV